MVDHQIVAAVLTAGMLPTISIPSIEFDGSVNDDDQRRLVAAIGHAVGLYRAVLYGLVHSPRQPNATTFGIAAETRADPSDCVRRETFQGN